MRYSKTPLRRLSCGTDCPSHAVQSRRDLYGYLAIEVIELSPERAATLRIDILRDLHHR